MVFFAAESVMLRFTFNVTKFPTIPILEKSIQLIDTEV